MGGKRVHDPKGPSTGGKHYPIGPDLLRVIYLTDSTHNSTKSQLMWPYQVHYVDPVRWVYLSH